MQNVKERRRQFIINRFGVFAGWLGELAILAEPLMLSKEIQNNIFQALPIEYEILVT
jgi:hypothetical protein